MSEKRFEISKDKYFIFDNTEDDFFDLEDVVNKLNEQHEEIDYLKNLISAMKSDIKNAMRIVSRWNDE